MSQSLVNMKNDTWYVRKTCRSRKQANSGTVEQDGSESSNKFYCPSFTFSSVVITNFEYCSVTYPSVISVTSKASHRCNRLVNLIVTASDENYMIRNCVCLHDCNVTSSLVRLNEKGIRKTGTESADNFIYKFLKGS